MCSAVDSLAPGTPRVRSSCRVRVLDGVRVLGFVADLGELFAQVRVLLAPVQR